MTNFSLVKGVSRLEPPPPPPAAPPVAPPAASAAAKVLSPPTPHHFPDSMFVPPSKSPSGLSTTGMDTHSLSQILHAARWTLNRLTN